MIMRIVRLAGAVLLLVSIVLNILTFTGLLTPQPLIKEKEDTIARFTERVKALEENNRELEKQNSLMAKGIEESKAANAAAQKKLNDLLAGYRKLQEDMQ